jgi:hypothetical protein
VSLDKSGSAPHEEYLLQPGSYLSIKSQMPAAVIVCRVAKGIRRLTSPIARVPTRKRLMRYSLLVKLRQGGLAEPHQLNIFRRRLCYRGQFAGFCHRNLCRLIKAIVIGAIVLIVDSKCEDRWATNPVCDLEWIANYFDACAIFRPPSWRAAKKVIIFDPAIQNADFSLLLNIHNIFLPLLGAFTCGVGPVSRRWATNRSPVS